MSCHREKNGWWEDKRWEQSDVRLRSGWSSRWKCSGACWPRSAVNGTQATTALEGPAPATRPKDLGGLPYEGVEREVGDWKRFVHRRQVGSYTCSKLVKKWPPRSPESKRAWPSPGRWRWTCGGGAPSSPTRSLGLNEDRPVVGAAPPNPAT